MLRFATLDFFSNCSKYYNQCKFKQQIGLPTIANFPNLSSNAAIINEIKRKNDKIIKMQIEETSFDFSNEKNKYNKDYSKFYCLKNVNKQFLNKNQDKETEQNGFELFSFAAFISLASFSAIYMFRKIVFKKIN
jgi:hypothetical protein